MSEDNSEHEITINHKSVKALHVPMSATYLKSAIETAPTADNIFAELERHDSNEYLNSIMHELEDQRIPEINQQLEFAIKSASMKDLREAAKLASENAIEHYLIKHPEADGLGFKFSGTVYIKKNTQINYPLVLKQMLDCILDRRAGFTSQKAILESVKKSTGISDLNANIWCLPLKRYMKAILYERLEVQSFKISLSSCSNMSDVRKAIDTHYAKQQAVHKLKLDLTITRNEIIVNGNSHKISTVPSGAYEYKKIRLLVNGKRTWLNVDELKVFFGLAI